MPLARQGGSNLCVITVDAKSRMGNSKNITNKTFEEAASASGKKPDEAKKNVLELLEKQQAAKK